MSIMQSGKKVMICMFIMKRELFFYHFGFYDPNVGSMAHNTNVTGAPPPGVAPGYHRESALPNPHFEMKGRNQPAGKAYEMRQAPQPYV